MMLVITSVNEYILVIDLCMHALSQHHAIKEAGLYPYLTHAVLFYTSYTSPLSSANKHTHIQ